jgi:hypothetical protein
MKLASATQISLTLCLCPPASSTRLSNGTRGFQRPRAIDDGPLDDLETGAIEEILSFD